MATVTNGRHLFNEIPEGFPTPGKTTIYDESQTISLEDVPLNGGFLIKVLALSIDPYMRHKMRATNTKSFTPAFELGKPLYNHGVGVVLRSELDGIKAGDHVYGLLSFEQYILQPNADGIEIIKNDENISWSSYVGAAGMPGQTAFVAWKEFSKAKKGETVFVSTAAGAVGSVVVQIAKSQGLKVIASAGSEEKIKFLKEIGADVAFNYKTTDTAEVLAKEGPIDIYWDNVGGKTLEDVIDAANDYIRIIACGAISSYNTTDNYGIKNWGLFFVKRVSINGFVVFDLLPKYREEFFNTIPKMIAQGEIKFLEDRKVGLDKVGEAIYEVQSGTNHGKSVIIVADS
ncbi:hypothetical protein HGRIS_010305 [Hohenbuehelia grisea]|uniref:Enoyl reductase (ER) domain-containing protein n=1 Tax=Hohenbuehelia grisea TaxID=104357 RepID=A0ABR3J3X7_9AGAR